MKHFIFISSIFLGIILIYKFMINKEERIGFNEKLKRVILIASIAILYNRSIAMLLL